MLTCISQAADINLELCQKIKNAEFFEKKVPTTMLVELGKSVDVDDAMESLFNPQIFTELSDPMREMITKFKRSYMSNILRELASEDRYV